MAVRMTRRCRVELGGSGSTIDVVSIPCHFNAPKFQSLNDLFIPMLSLAQQVSDLMALRVCDNKAAFRAAAYLAGELLRDESFSPTRSWTPAVANAYTIDLAANRFEAETAIQDLESEGLAIFCVRIIGPIRGDKFVVTDSVNNSSLFSFTRFEAEKPEFFVREFPFIAREARRDPSMFKDRQDSLAHGMIDLMLGVPVEDKVITVRVLKQSATSVVEVKNPVTNSTLLELPIASLYNLSKLMDSVAKHLTANAVGSDLLSAAGIAHR
jgi:hypothetical protein